MSRGQSKDKVFLKGLSLGLMMYFPVMALTMPCPPEVPGSQAAMMA